MPTLLYRGKSIDPRLVSYTGDNCKIPMYVSCAILLTLHDCFLSMKVIPALAETTILTQKEQVGWCPHPWMQLQAHDTTWTKETCIENILFHCDLIYCAVKHSKHSNIGHYLLHFSCTQIWT